MQELLFEASWEKALSTQDRQSIEAIFNETKHFNTFDLLFSTLRTAINHKEALLVTVLVHNYSNHLLTFSNTKISYHIEEKCIAEQKFTLPALVIPSKVSMPWTFIFPKGNYIPQPSYENGRLVIH